MLPDPRVRRFQPRGVFVPRLPRRGGCEEICDALRGGDAWDQKIRTQFKECALFVPIISANTQARAEGYFRLEWRLADQRTHLMGKSKAFLLPVGIDGTRDGDA